MIGNSTTTITTIIIIVWQQHCKYSVIFQRELFPAAKNDDNFQSFCLCVLTPPPETGLADSTAFAAGLDCFCVVFLVGASFLAPSVLVAVGAEGLAAAPADPPGAALTSAFSAHSFTFRVTKVVKKHLKLILLSFQDFSKIMKADSTRKEFEFEVKNQSHKVSYKLNRISQNYFFFFKFPFIT